MPISLDEIILHLPIDRVCSGVCFSLQEEIVQIEGQVCRVPVEDDHT